MPGASKPTTRFLDTDLGLWLAGAAAVTSLISIVASEILIAAAILASLRKSPKGLPVWPLGLWFALTIVPALLLGFGRSGFPQIKKLYWFAMLAAMAMGFRAASVLVRSG